MLKAKQEDIVIVGAARTPVGAYLGGLKTVPVQELGVVALDEAIKRSGLAKEDIDEVIVGHVTGSQTTNNLGNIIAIDAGLDNRVTGMTINRICGSGIQSAISATLELLMGKKEIIAAGGAESLSRAPFYLPESIRYEPFRMGDQQLIDANLEGHRSSSGTNSGIAHMGNTAENVVRRYNISREAQDEFAFNSQMKAKEALENGRFSQEIIPVEVKGRRGSVTIVDTDEHPKPQTTIEGLAKLRPAFEKDGSVTAGNASGLNDGAAFEIFTTESVAQAKGLEVMGRVVDYAITGCAPDVMGLGPVAAIQEVLRRNELDLEKDIDVLEINEAFAGQTLGCLHELNISTDSDFYKNNFNPHGGAVALGHPLGMSGARIITSLLYEFKNRPEIRYAIASACIGGGQGIALLLENGYYKG
ncbi:thiolase family protein [Streptococcus uberis]|uniref:thiolase family protein n=1 Tax=Streptococcus uberis TaxID=1349 RepID=UPI001FF4B330|nr:thiolase family protein [Streptococcus uberis]MCK1166249.1 thiolase family protein [Streptococcus uberis]MCK1195547.1 thiolase family protein [Streptococcus uberis]MCK1204313.1 thiolase family protein [Streptococcus uberis]MCK1232149.1 thiolase family protein [Streptococcus uberis]MCK1245415.1 thiolase family protein [Streptococcus uberis]